MIDEIDKTTSSVWDKGAENSSTQTDVCPLRLTSKQTNNKDRGGPISHEQLLTVLDGMKERKDCLIVATANDISSIAETMLRPGRLGGTWFSNWDTWNLERCVEW